MRTARGSRPIDWSARKTSGATSGVMSWNGPNSPPVPAMSGAGSTATGTSVGFFSTITAFSAEPVWPVSIRISATYGASGAERRHCAPSTLAAGRSGAQAVHRRDEARDVDAGVVLAALGRRLDHVERLRVAPLVAIVISTRPRRGGERVAALEFRRHRLAPARERGREALHVVVFREGDRGRQDAQALVLLQGPGCLQVPPGEGIEQVVEPGLRRGAGLLEGAAQVSAAKSAAWSALLGGADQAAPHVRRHLVGGIAPEARRRQGLEPGDVAVPQVRQRGARAGLDVVELGEVAPDGDLRGIVGIHRCGLTGAPEASRTKISGRSWASLSIVGAWFTPDRS